MKQLISIIIPCFNRAHLIIETLQSIEKQSYENWECIIIDDGSIDATTKVVGDFILSRPRFKYIIRPQYQPKGANTCRNIGLKMAHGDYVMFFDSDDLMTIDHLSIKIKAVQDDCDVVIARTMEFNHPDPSNPFISDLERYHFDRFTPDLFNYALQHVNWLTPDSMIKTTLARSIHFNEDIHRGQEYNYYCKLLALKPRIKVIDDYVSLRRMHSESIKSKLRSDHDISKRAISKVVTLEEIKDKAPILLIKKMISQIALDLTAGKVMPGLKYWLLIVKNLKTYTSFKAALYFMLSSFSQLSTGKNHFFRTKLKAALYA